MNSYNYRIPDMSMVDLPKIETKFERSELGLQLHATILEDMKSKKFDPFAERNYTSVDQAFQNSLKMVEKDKTVRANLHGPSELREKYSSSYWRKWNKEKNLLEDISYENVIINNLASYLSSTTRKSYVQQRSAEERELSEAIQLRNRKARAAAKCRAVAFDAPGAYEKFSMYVGNENKGDTSVPFLLKACLKRDLPKNPREVNATKDPDDIGARPRRGGAFSLSRKLGATAVPITAKCDFPPLETPIDPHKGAAFGTAPRFKYSAKLAPVSAPAGDDVTLSTIERPVHTPGGRFDQAERFARKDARASVVVRIPVRPEGSVVSSLSGGPSTTEEENSRIIEPKPSVDGACPPSSASTSSGRPSSATGMVSTATLTARSADCASQDSSRPPPVSTVERQFIEFEYFPNDQPGPGHYEVSRLFDGNVARSSAEFDALIAKYRAVKPGLAGLKCEDLTNIAAFGQQCNRQEHVLYGMCLDGKCCRRSEVEKVMLRRNDLRRMAGYAAVEKHGRQKERLREEILYGRALVEALPAAEYTVTPLYAAAYSGDITAIESLAKLKINPNVQHPDSGYTALHAAVFRCKLKAVAALLDCFRGTLRLDLQDKKGDTALHIASRLGFVEIAGLICDEESCDPLCTRNQAGQYPIEVVRSHKVFQMIKLCQTRNELRRELCELREKRC